MAEIQKSQEKSGSKGGGDYYRIVVRPEDEFETFRYHDIGEPGHIQRLAGKRKSGSWATQTWLIGKHDAHLEGNKIVPDTDDARQVIGMLATEPIRIEGDVFEAKDEQIGYYGLAGGKSSAHSKKTD